MDIHYLTTEAARCRLYLAGLEALGIDEDGKTYPHKTAQRAWAARLEILARRHFSDAARAFAIAGHLLDLAASKSLDTFAVSVDDVTLNFHTDPDTAVDALRCCGCTERAPGEWGTGNTRLFGAPLRAVA